MLYVAIPEHVPIVFRCDLRQNFEVAVTICVVPSKMSEMKLALGWGERLNGIKCCMGLTVV